MPQEKHCQICGQAVTDSPLTLSAHLRTHKIEFRVLVGRDPADFDELREMLVHANVPEDDRLREHLKGKADHG